MFQKLYKHLEEISGNTSQHQSALVRSEEWAAKISEQLEALNFSVLAQRKQPPSRGWQVANLSIACAGIALIVILAFYCFNLSRSLQLTMNRSVESSRLTGVAFMNYHELNQEQADTKLEIFKLDSLVQEQAQSIRELKKLNEVAVRAFLHIKKDLDQRQADRVSLKQAVVR